jgi:hypothetical protein
MLILRWNGTAWTRVPSPKLGPDFALQGVTATSADNAWTVGWTQDSLEKTLILHWNGATWTQVPSPNLGMGEITGVAAKSASSAWAVGNTLSGASTRPLILR